MSLYGLLNIHKPTGITSRRVVDQIQRLVRPAKVGHAGTLDPLASGVLVIGLGQATRLVEYVQQMPKNYRATFLLGRESDTEDIEGEVTILAGSTPPLLTQLEGAIAELTGEIQQRPPAYSALKIAGQRAYSLARAGQSVDLLPRAVHIHRLELVRYEYPELCLDVECSSGTYIRSLGRDLAQRVGTGAVMSALVRTAIGKFTLADAIDTAQLTRYNLTEFLLPAALAVQGIMPECEVSEIQVSRLAHGMSIAVPLEAEGPCAALDEAGQLVAILSRKEDGTWGPAKFFPSQP